MNLHYITPDPISPEQALHILKDHRNIALSERSVVIIERCYHYLHHKLATAESPVYGINTGFGSLCNTRINKEDLSKLQENLVKSHACGMGEEVPTEIVKLMMLLKIQALALGHSGVSLATVHRLIAYFNQDIIPVVYQQGSLGASGDLAPLAHLSLPLLGIGEVYYKQEKRFASDVLKEVGLEPMQLEAKEGLALLNGTQFMSAYGTWCISQMKRLSVLSDVIAALSLDAFEGLSAPFHSLIQVVRPHHGQMLTAANMRHLLSGSEIQLQAKSQVQDPYTFRCIPQVHGASKDQLVHIEKIIHTEINAVTDNPTIFPEEDLIISGGNFHGQPLALSYDLLAIAAAELASISERRVYKLISGQRGLPPFLVAEPGLNSGFMIPQYTAASIVSQNKQLCTPSSIDSIDSSNGQEDHVSMGANGATKAYKVVSNLEKVLAIELMNAAQALEFRRPAKSSPVLEAFLAEFRKSVPSVKEDVYMHLEMERAVSFLRHVTLPEGISAW